MTFMPSFTTEEELRAHQLQGLQWTLGHAYDHAEYFRRSFDAAGVKPEDVRTLDDLRRLPLLTADALKDGYPFPLLSVPMAEVVRIHASSGTTGKRKVLSYTQKDIDDWADMFARCYEMAGLTREDRVQIAVGYGVWTAGVGFQLGCERFGALAIPIGPGNIDLQCRFLQDFQSTVLCCTASMGLLMAEQIRARGLRDKINLRKIIYGSERSSDAMRARISALLGAGELYDIPGMTELYGPGTGLECRMHDGIHYWADYYLVEIIDPVTLEPVAEGEMGEMVVTTLRKEAVPLVRYRTRDLTRLIPGRCACGSILPRHDRLLGRSDDMIIFRAVNIYPGQIDEILSGLENVGSEYQIHLTRDEAGLDHLTIKIEREEGVRPDADQSIAVAVREAVKNQVMVSAAVEVVDYGSLPRSERKSKRVFDHRFE
ncbi:MAG: phenylacetate--CoA ligase [Proteobacteria bacterium]|nr:phenylacetate--CoA ligase [Pseudomonadota bacterium]